MTISTSLPAAFAGLDRRDAEVDALLDQVGDRESGGVLDENGDHQPDQGLLVGA